VRRVEPEQISGVRILEGRIAADERGHFVKAAEDSMLDPAPGHSGRQLCCAVNVQAGTLRGLHFQVAPYTESKLVWCVVGQVWDVLVDVRADQPTYGRWAGVRLDAGAPQVLRVPPGVAHGYQTLSNHAVLVYLIDGQYSRTHGRTLRWDDPTLGIEWPMPVSLVSAKDQAGAAWPPGS
jgi:dTDP-4-dehydrorhamnose 3,5-epimerase